ncbi:MAG: alpha/beta hydrolase [Promethearchaeota archaeon]
MHNLPSKIRGLGILSLIVGGLLLTSSSVFLFAVTHEIEIQPISFNNEGITIAGLLYHPSNDPQGVVIVIHGYGGRKESLLSLSLALAQQNYLVLGIDLRNHGDSGGAFDLGLAESRDVSKAIDFLETHGYLSEGTFLALFGISFGGSVAIIAGASDPRVSAVVTVATIGNLSRWLEEGGNMPALNRIAYLTATTESFSSLDVRSAVNYAANVSSLLIIHGRLDDLVPVEHAYDLVSVAPQAKLEIVNNADHAVPAPFVINTSLTWFNSTSQGGDYSRSYIIDVLINLSWLAEWLGMFFLLGGIFLFTGSYFKLKSFSNNKRNESVNQSEKVSPVFLIALAIIGYITINFVIESSQSSPDLVIVALLSRFILLCPFLIYFISLLYSTFTQNQLSNLTINIQFSREVIYELLIYAGVFFSAWFLYSLFHVVLLLPFSSLISFLNSPILPIIAWAALFDEFWFRWFIQGKLSAINSHPLKIGISASLYVLTKTSYTIFIMTFWRLPLGLWIPAVTVLFIFVGLSTSILYEYTNGLKTSSAHAITILTLMLASTRSSLFI